MKNEISRLLCLTTMCSLLFYASKAHAYTYNVEAKSPKEAFVSQQVGLTLQFTLETRNAPPGVVFNSEKFNGTVDFGNGNRQKYTAYNATSRDGFVQSTLTKSTQYNATGNYQIITTGSLHDEVCTESTCFPFDRVITPVVKEVRIYDPKTSMDAVRLALGTARAKLMELGNPNPSNLDIARLAYSEAILMRSHDSTTSTDPALRDAEYMLRGYAGGLLLRTLDPTQIGGGGPLLGDFGNDLANLSGPVGAVVYNLGKIVTHAVGGSVSTDGLTPSSPGGIEANTYGFLAGAGGKSPEELTSSPNYSTPINKQDSSVQSPIKPDLSIGRDGDLYSPGIMTFDANPDTTYYLDPDRDSGMAFAAAGNAFRSITLPGSIFSPEGQYKLIFGSSEFSITPDVEFNFTEFVSEGVAGFVIMGMPADVTGDLSIAARFMDWGRVLVAVDEFNADATVPEPSTLPLILLTIPVLAVTSRRRSKRRLESADPAFRPDHSRQSSKELADQSV